MELGPISGIRSVRLPQSRRIDQGETPPLVIDASAPAGDEPGSSSQQSPSRRQDPEQSRDSSQDNLLEEQAAEATELAPLDDDPNRPADSPVPGHDWFV